MGRILHPISPPPMTPPAAATADGDGSALPWGGVQHRVPAQCARVLILRMHTNAASFVIQPHVVACRIRAPR